jgi:CheY-like chemotaxis protein
MDKLKILIAEDSKIAQEQYKTCLPDETYKKRFVENGEMAVELYKSFTPDIILLDLMMPIKSGYAALKDIREIESSLEKKTAVIVVTSMMEKEDIIDCAKLGIQGYIVKPINSKKLSNTILDYYNKFIESQK